MRNNERLHHLNRLAEMLSWFDYLHDSSKRHWNQESTADAVKVSLQLLGLCEIQMLDIQQYRICTCNIALSPKNVSEDLVPHQSLGAGLHRALCSVAEGRGIERMSAATKS
jgi:hypothetical protein